MSTSAITNNGPDALRYNRIGLLRRGVAGALLATSISTTAAVGLAATSHADDNAPPPNAGAAVSAVTAPTLDAPWLPLIDQFGGYGPLRYCSPHWAGFWHCH
ncbi:hypothetical protein [Mycobacterium angelicum]|uniref:Uncharacterized protein n=1 Tax=Mycobacterium angelicum TaxID=470074 RepID=A0A1W9ZDE5_MYCAN|nr:hypothetical protein [Mycobacterium angelicum]MCV7198050.1 hypothetical protein [Mycobacterium angelicum]ORA12702.1 hypothetical protein BST12_24685 [Mycobacterium angelicum]